MANLIFEQIGIKAVSSCVPKNIERTKELTNIFSSAEDAEKFIKSTGIEQRHISDTICSSDLCLAAAKQLISENQIDTNSIDVLLFMSQTGDYKIPATSTILQERLGLSKDTACMDLNLACSGFIYGLATAFSFANNPHINKVLLLTGETLSKVLNKNDSTVYPIFGDAGTAVLIEKGNYKTSFFCLGTDGRGAKTIIIPSENGGRTPITAFSVEEREQSDHIKRSDLQMFMDGMGVFSFTLQAVPKNINNVLDLISSVDSTFNKENIDYYLLHQANKLIIDTMAKRLRIPAEKVPTNIKEFGNVSSASIPLLLTTEFGADNVFSKNCIMCGFGAGLSWGAAYISFEKCNISKLIEL